MCLSKAYVYRGEGKELLMEEVASLDIEDGKLRLKNLFGKEREIDASIRQINFVAHSIFLEDLKHGDTG